MSIPTHEEGLVRIYVDKVAALGVRALEGTEVKEDVTAVVGEATAHFAVVKTSTEIGNLKRFSGSLSVAATATHESQPEYRATFALAKELTDKIIEEKEA